MKVKDAMKKEVVTVDEDDSVMEASKRMREKHEGCAVVLRGGEPVGMVTERDVTWNVAGKGLDPKAVKVREIMSTPLITISPEADFIEATKLMCKNRIRRLAVTSNHTLQGVITAAIIASHLEGYLDSEVRKILKAAFFPFPH
ncbi:MAG: CBS domain-containing protein [Candidatus Bathyarchaeia archaeon]